MKRKLGGAAALVFLVLLVTLHRPLIVAVLGTQDAKPFAIGNKVPEFSVTDVSGKRWTIGDLQKRTASGVVSLTFWCTFCHSCRMMDARFQKTAAEFKDKAAILAVDASAADSARKVEDFTREKNFSVPVFLDADAKAADLFGVRVTTTTFVIDKAGVLRYRGQFGSEDNPYAQNALRAVLEGKEVTVKETAAAG